MNQSLSITRKVNRYFAVDSEIKRLEIKRDELRKALIATGQEYFEGKKNALKVVETVRWSLKTKEVKEEMGESWWARRCAQTLSSSLRVTKKLAERGDNIDLKI